MDTNNIVTPSSSSPSRFMDTVTNEFSNQYEKHDRFVPWFATYASHALSLLSVVCQSVYPIRVTGSSVATRNCIRQLTSQLTTEHLMMSTARKTSWMPPHRSYPQITPSQPTHPKATLLRPAPPHAHQQVPRCCDAVPTWAPPHHPPTPCAHPTPCCHPVQNSISHALSPVVVCLVAVVI